MAVPPPAGCRLSGFRQRQRPGHRGHGVRRRPHSRHRVRRREPEPRGGRRAPRRRRSQRSRRHAWRCWSAPPPRRNTRSPRWSSGADPESSTWTVTGIGERSASVWMAPARPTSVRTAGWMPAASSRMSPRIAMASPRSTGDPPRLTDPPNPRRLDETAGPGRRVAAARRRAGRARSACVPGHRPPRSEPVTPGRPPVGERPHARGARAARSAEPPPRPPRAIPAPRPARHRGPRPRAARPREPGP